MDIWFLFMKKQAERLFTRTLVENLNYFGIRPWAELVRVRSAAAPQGVTDLWLAQRLRPYGIRPTTMRIGEELGKGYLLGDFAEVFRRYIPRAEIEALKAELKMRKEQMEEKKS